MPRKAPEKVTEHRVTLGDYERKLITKQLDEDDTLNKARTYAQVGKSIAIGGAVVGGTIAVATIGTLAVSAYREAAGLVDQAQDMKTSAWTYFKYRLGIGSFDDVVDETQDYLDNKEEREAAAERRKNMGILEYGLDRILVFLLGADKQWTATTLVKEDELNGNGDGDSQNYKDYQYQQFVERTSAIWGSVENYQRIANEFAQWRQMIEQFCTETSKDFDRDVCQATQEDYNEWKRRTIAEYGQLP